jgi:hypothetical protein
MSEQQAQSLRVDHTPVSSVPTTPIHTAPRRKLDVDLSGLSLSLDSSTPSANITGIKKAELIKQLLEMKQTLEDEANYRDEIEQSEIELFEQVFCFTNVSI